MTRTAFDLPQFSIRQDREGLRWYGNVSNLLEVASSDLRVHYVAIEVPTLLFSLMRGVFAVPVDSPAFLAIDEVRDGRWRYVLSLRYGADELVDLWRYTAADAPKWVFNRGCFIHPSEEQLQVLLT
jgi:hypothetical protein